MSDKSRTGPEADLAFSQAMQQQPEELSTYLEAGDTWLENQGWAQAINWYDQALALHPEHAWAAPSRDYCQWRATGDDALLQRVIDAAKADNERAYQLWFLASGAPPQPNDASANVLRKIRDSLLDGMVVNIARYGIKRRARMRWRTRTDVGVEFLDEVE